MRRITLLIAVVAMFAFQANAQIKTGLTIGANMANIKQDMAKDYEMMEQETKSLLLPRVGLTVDLNIPGPIGVGTGIFYSAKGYQVDLEKDNEDATKRNFDGTSKTSIGYIEIPAHLKYNIAVMHFYVGPYVGMGIMGKEKNDFTYEYKDPTNPQADWEEIKDDTELDAEFTNEVKSNFDGTKNFPVKGMDMGLDFGLGFKVTKIGGFVGYTMGLANITPDFESVDNQGNSTTISGDKMKVKNSAVQFGVTYYF